MHTHRAESGFSLLELIVASGLAAMLTAALAATFSTSSGLSNRSSTVLRVNEEHRRNLDAVADAMRGAAASTLGGFDAGGNATEPTFQCVAGCDGSGLVLDETCRIWWRPSTIAVTGVEQPGDLVMTQGTVEAVVARRVPAGGFRVSRLGSSLRISMTTFSPGPNQLLETLSGQTSLTLRN